MSRCGLYLLLLRIIHDEKDHKRVKRLRSVQKQFMEATWEPQIREALARRKARSRPRETAVGHLRTTGGSERGKDASALSQLSKSTKSPSYPVRSCRDTSKRSRRTTLKNPSSAMRLKTSQHPRPMMNWSTRPTQRVLKSRRLGPNSTRIRWAQCLQEGSQD